AVDEVLNHINPGLVNSSELLVPGTLAAGTGVQSYMIRFDPGSNNGITRAGWVIFDAPILGVMMGRGRLNETDNVLGRPDVTYNMNNNRGMEPNEQEHFEISADRLRVDFTMNVTNFPTDDIRVVTMIPVCAGDFNRDGLANSADFFDFLTAFFVNEPSADVNGDELVNSQDFFDFLAAFFAGC
ncbi:MAG: hypothetical protein H7210_06555, partial [Pyrinomonadaceae bacterium]|nr:hypothetical protein [Phycisphaerales bacterium]